LIDLIEKSNEDQYKAYKFLNDLIAKNDEKGRLKKDDLIARLTGIRRFPERVIPSELREAQISYIEHYNHFLYSR
jgi:hypothetical protein